MSSGLSWLIGLCRAVLLITVSDLTWRRPARGFSGPRCTLRLARYRLLSPAIACYRLLSQPDNRRLAASRDLVYCSLGLDQPLFDLLYVRLVFGSSHIVLDAADMAKFTYAELKESCENGNLVLRLSDRSSHSPLLALDKRNTFLATSEQFYPSMSNADWRQYQDLWADWTHLHEPVVQGIIDHVAHGYYKTHKASLWISGTTSPA